ncbi:MAG: hypothetical protein AB7H86_21605 [Blastocatellales bacterium]
MKSSLKLLSVSVLLLLIPLSIASGQSGRKQKKTPPQPPVQGVNQPEARVQPDPTIEPEKEEEKAPQRTIMVLSSMPDVQIPIFYADAARRGCLSELRDAMKSVDLREDRNSNRSDAIKLAKDDDSTWVLLLDLELDRLGTSRIGVEVRYSMFEPKTAKVIASGIGYPVQPNTGTPMPPVGASWDQVYLDWMGRDVARQVMRRMGAIP